MTCSFVVHQLLFRISEFTVRVSAMYVGYGLVLVQDVSRYPLTHSSEANSPTAPASTNLT